RDFHSWGKWSPWIIAEPDTRIDVASDGRSYSWEGEIVGSGNIRIDREEPGKAIYYTLTFLKPWKSTSPVSFLFEPEAAGVKLTWTMVGSMPFFLFFMTKMMGAFIGMDYDRGLSMLKDYIETGVVPSKLEFPGLQKTAGFSYIGLKTQCAVAGVGEAMRKDFDRICSFLGAEQGAFKNCFAIYHKWDLVKGVGEYTACCPVDEAPQNLPEGFFAGDFPDCQAYLVQHTGPYRHLGNAWAAGMMHGRAKRFKQSKQLHPFETYQNDPATTPDRELVTNIHFPIK
ncbi:MAG: SRPBCC family protein, partial [Verrucomicrobiae bacterium]|nr:SRPBCC family protein [Verrucomicrobiae bacterium]